MKFRFYALKLTLICVIIFILQLVFPGFTDFFILNERSFFEIWRFLTSIFLHGGFGHLIYNGFALALFGSMLEKFIGGKRFLLVFFACGIVANIISINFYNSSLGASGAIYGIFGTLVLIRPFMLVWAFGLPMPMLVAGILWAGGDLIGLFIPSNVGHIAHLSGMLLGLILGAVFRKYYLNVNRRGQEGRDMHMDEISMRRWEEDYLK